MTAPALYSVILVLLTALAAGLVGSFALMKRMSLAGDVISHIALPGLGLALLFHFNPLVGAAATLFLGTLLIWRLQQGGTLTTDVAIGVIFTAALASGGLLVFFAIALFSWWLAVLLLVLGLAGAPAVVRELRRRRHHHEITERGPTAADAAWTELLAESLDRGMAVPPSDTLRVAAQRMVREHDLDTEGRESLRTLVGEVERSWYGGDTTVSTVVVESFDRVRRSLHRNAPLAMRARLLPKSVLRPSKRHTTDNDGDESDST